jgi:hypothetical protein
MSQDVIEPMRAMTGCTSRETESDSDESDEDGDISSDKHFTIEGFKAGDSQRQGACASDGRDAIRP